MRLVILSIFLLIGCDQSIRNNRVGNDALTLLAITVNNTNIKNTVTFTNNDGSSVELPVGMGAGSSVNDVTQFTRGDFRILARNLTWFDAHHTCNSIGYRISTYSEFLIFIKQLEYIKKNFNRVPTTWQSLWQVARQGEYSYWISDRDYLYDDDLAYAPKSFPGSYVVDWRFEYMDTNLGWVYNKRADNIRGLCYKTR